MEMQLSAVLRMELRNFVAVGMISEGTEAMGLARVSHVSKKAT